jgi:ATP-dependent DNA ligase
MLVNLFDKIKHTSSTKEKRKLLAEYNDVDKADLLEVLKLAYSKEIVFGLTSGNIVLEKKGLFEYIPVKLFKDLLENSGRNDRIKLIENTLQNHTAIAQEYFLNILDKDLGIGINTKLINSVFPNLIPEFKIMLAQRDNKELFLRIFQNLDYCYVNLKIDGLRCVVNCQSRDLKFYSRDGHLLSDFLVENIKRDMLANFNAFEGKIVDGELYSNSFQKLMQVAMRKKVDSNSIAIRNTCFYAIFDIVDLEKTQEERVKIVEGFPTTIYLKKLKYLKVKPDYSLLRNLADKYIEEGHEGIIIKHPLAKYEGKRSNNWIKMKPCHDADYPIVDVIEGEGKYQGMLGALVLKLDNGNLVNVGTGFSDEDRVSMWKEKSNLIGKLCEIKYMEKTEGAESLRHPVFSRIRIDKEI